MIEIRRCRSDEIGLVMAFIDRHWQNGHVLAASRDLMDWQHGAGDGSYDYLVALRDGALLGILGYIPTRRFDPQLADCNVIWLALWKVLEDCGITGLGIRMLGALRQVEPHVAIAVNGINSAHPPMYRALGYSVAELQRYCMVNPDQPQRLVCAQGCLLPQPNPGNGRFSALSEKALDALPAEPFAGGAIPAKTPRYFLHRFLRHPFYAYRVYLATGPGHGPALLATRIAEHEGARALRIVDFAGDPAAIASCGTALADLMREEGAEFADFWQYGLPDEPFAAAGFSRLSADGAPVVPNYFEPFLPANGRMLCAVRASGAAVPVIFRADGDQDRPNRLPAAR